MVAFSMMTLLKTSIRQKFADKSSTNEINKYITYYKALCTILIFFTYSFVLLTGLFSDAYQPRE